MRRSITFQGFSLTLLLLVQLTSASSQKAWSQNAVPALAASAPEPQAATPAKPAGSMLMIGGGDLLKVSVLGAPDSDQEVRVTEDGNVFLNFIVAAGGFFTQPQVSVFTKEYATQGVSVLGEVQKPGVYPILGPRRLFDVLSLAGGTGPRAGRIVSITRREHPESPQSVMLSNDANESAKVNVEVFPGDTVLVSRAGVVYISGSVHKPSGVIMDNSSEMTVLQAIAMAEGALPDAALNKSKLIRRTPNGPPQEIPLHLKDMLASKSPDIRLQAEDIVFVPNSAAKSAGKRTLDAIISTTTGLIIYGVRP